MMIITVKSQEHTQFIDITSDIHRALEASGLREGLCYIASLHTTAAITINENADPAVQVDLKQILGKLIPWEDGYQHMDGNSAAHMKTSLIGNSEWIAVENGRLVLGTWQGIYFCEFDGPRTRKVYVKFIE
jgi:secondary thiamine-phosphate synthase enzyme